MSSFTICLPTYNERENIDSLIPKLLKIFDENEKAMKGSILVIDDNSPDGTADIVRQWCKKDNRISLLLRKGKEGLGKAYIAGFKEAFKSNPDIIFEMDADHSHDPEVIPEMIKMIESDKDFVVGSRKIKGGDNPDWPIRRKIISSGANMYTRSLLRLKVHDVTSGYRAFKTGILTQIKLDEINTSGYAFQIEIAYLVEKLLKARVGEVPIVFLPSQRAQ